MVMVGDGVSGVAPVEWEEKESDDSQCDSAFLCMHLDSSSHPFLSHESHQPSSTPVLMPSSSSSIDVEWRWQIIVRSGRQRR